MYTTDFVFDSLMDGNYRTDIGKIAYIGKQKVLCLITESMYAAKEGFTSPNHRIYNIIRECLNKSQGRIIFNVLNSHLYIIQELFNEVSKTEKKIVVMGKKLQNLINNGIANGYLSIDKRFIGDLSNLNDKNAVILNSNEREKPYYNIIKIVNGYDKFIKLNEEDTIFLATPIFENREKTFYHLLDEISKVGSKVVTLSSHKYLSHHAAKEDLMIMINLMHPKYYFPIRGEYKDQVLNAEIGELSGIPKENILLKENGDVVIIENGILKENFEKVLVEINTILATYINKGNLVSIDEEKLQNIKFDLIDLDTETKTLSSYFAEWSLLWLESIISLRMSEIKMGGVNNGR